MVVSAQIRIAGSRAAVWSLIADVAGWASVVRGVQAIEIVARPASGLTGLRWKETRLLFDKPTTVEKWVTDAKEHEYYVTRAEQDGFVFTTTLRLSEQDGHVVVTSTHRTDATTFAARVRALPLVFFKGVIRKAIVEDLVDFKNAAEGATPA